MLFQVLAFLFSCFIYPFLGSLELPVGHSNFACCKSDLLLGAIELLVSHTRQGKHGNEAFNSQNITISAILAELRPLEEDPVLVLPFVALELLLLLPPKSSNPEHDTSTRPIAGTTCDKSDDHNQGNDVQSNKGDLQDMLAFCWVVLRPVVQASLWTP